MKIIQIAETLHSRLLLAASACERREGEAPFGFAGGGGWSLPYKVQA